MKLSIIIPTTGNKKYFERAIESINIKKINYEILLINDSNKKLEYVNQKYSNKNVRLINNSKTPSWVKITRYNGIISTSKNTTHIMFIDDDDTMTNENFEDDLINNPTKIIQYGFFRTYLNFNEPEPATQYIKEQPGSIQGFLWSKIYPKEIIKSFSNFMKNDNLNDDGPILRKYLYDFFENNKYFISNKKIINHHMYKMSESRNGTNLIRELNSYIELSNSKFFNRVKWEKMLVDRYECKKNLLLPKEKKYWKEKIEKIRKIKFYNKLIGFSFRYFKPYFWENLLYLIKGKRRIKK